MMFTIAIIWSTHCSSDLSLSLYILKIDLASDLRSALWRFHLFSAREVYDPTVTAYPWALKSSLSRGLNPLNGDSIEHAI